MRPAIVCQHISMDSEINSTERGQIFQNFNFLIYQPVLMLFLQNDHLNELFMIHYR